MKLQVPFIQLPLRFDAARLAAEIAHFDDADWLPHPLRFAGNSALPLVAVNGDPRDDDFAGPMLPTPHLLRCPYLQQILASLGAVWGRVRLMRLSGQSEVEPHVDINYYWHERVRVHIPIVTQPSVRFLCGDAEVNMASGECWIFDTWRRHRVINATDEQRIHLVADTVGSEDFWRIANAGYAPAPSMTRGRPTNLLELDPNSPAPRLLYESVNMPTVMTPWEMRQHLNFLFGEAMPHPNLQITQSAALRCIGRWQALWAQYGESRAGWREYRHVLDAFTEDLNETGGDILLQNGVKLVRCVMAMVVRNALADRPVSLTDQAVEAPSQEAPAQTATPAHFSPIRRVRLDRPVFIVSPPRSGSTLLFETLAQASNVFTIGEESHALIESIPELHPSASNYASNRLAAADASPEVAATLQAAFIAALRDRDGTRPVESDALRMLEKTPKNALRVPFMVKVFPHAHFIYLHRDPREVLASMIEAWNSGRFRTYPKLPGWPGPAWSLLLVPGWRELIGKSTHEIVAEQWRQTTDILLDDLAELPRERLHIARYAALRDDPAAEITRLCAEVGFVWDRTLGASLPMSRHTLSEPSPDKWRRHSDAIESVWPHIRHTVSRAEQFTAR